MPGQSIRIPHVCVTCGVTFQVFPCYVKLAAARGSTVKFCSNRCRFGPVLGMTQEELFVHHASAVPDANGCVIWSGHTGYGYGRLARNGDYVLAHRYAWERVYGPIPEGMCVCHRCDVRACVNIDHLFLGTHADNQLDKIEKQRHTRGEAVHCAKMTEDDVREMRRLCALGGRSLRSVARQFGITFPQLLKIIRRQNWKHVE